MADKNLEGKLRAIQELKREKYIGTLEAWTYIQRVAALYENPTKIANAINEAVSDKGPLHYRATPERILGLGDSFWEILFKAWMEIELCDESWFKYCEFEDNNPLYNFRELIAGPKDKQNPKKLIDYLMPVFSDVQSPKTTNYDFGLYAIQYTRASLIDEKLKLNILTQASLANWNYLLSRENFLKIERKIKNEIFSEEISIGSRIKRLERDRVDHRLEYRREILTDYIDLQMYNYNDVSYNFLIENLKRSLNNSLHRFERLKALNAPEEILNKEKDLIKRLKFLLTIFAPERNFVNKYLRS